MHVSRNHFGDAVKEQTSGRDGDVCVHVVGDLTLHPGRRRDCVWQRPSREDGLWWPVLMVIVELLLRGDGRIVAHLVLWRRLSQPHLFDASDALGAQRAEPAHDRADEAGSDPTKVQRRQRWNRRRRELWRESKRVNKTSMMSDSASKARKAERRALLI